jgi:hypothetical protein
METINKDAGTANHAVRYTILLEQTSIITGFSFPEDITKKKRNK